MKIQHLLHYHHLLHPPPHHLKAMLFKDLVLVEAGLIPMMKMTIGILMRMRGIGIDASMKMTMTVMIRIDKLVVIIIGILTIHIWIQITFLPAAKLIFTTKRMKMMLYIILVPHHILMATLSTLTTRMTGILMPEEEEIIKSHAS